MAGINTSSRDSFGSKFGIIAAAAGSAVGLGNIWRFPYVVGQNGGGAFLLIYIGFVILLGVPVMLSEFTIGRMAQRNPYGALKKLAPGRPWFLIGLMGIGAAFFILSYYSAVAGWTFEYVWLALNNSFAGKSPEQLQSLFDNFKTGSFLPAFWMLIFMAMTIYIVVAGVKDGIEKYAKILMPILLVLVLVLCVRSVSLPGASEGLKFIFQPDFSKINAEVILEALGQAFYSLSIGMGVLITYGSYISKKDDLGSTAVIVSGADTLIAILAGIAMFPAIFALGMTPDQGEGLAFKVLPGVFMQMPGGYIFALLFFLLLSVAALTSSISVLEVVTAFLVEEFNIKRKWAALSSGFVITLLGVLCALSWGPLKDFTIFGKNIFNLFDYLSANILLPVGGIFLVAFVGWQLGKRNTFLELSSEGKLKVRYLPIYMFIVKFIAPLAILLVFLNSIGIINL